MGCMFRSDKMSLCDIYLQPEIAFNLLSHLGEMGCVQIIDSHPQLQLFQKNFVQEVCRCSEMERKLRYMERVMKLHKIPMHSLQEQPKAAPVHELVQFEAMIEKWKHDIKEITKNEESLMQNYLKLTELLYVLQYIGPFLGQAEISTIKAQKRQKALVPGEIQTGRLSIVTGVVKRKKAFVFEMVLWRISRGMIYYRQATEDKILIDPRTRREIRKVAFLALCQGDTLAAGVTKVCSGFKINTYPCPNTYVEREEMIEKLKIRIEDMEKVLANTRFLRCKALWTVSKQWQGWMAQVCKSKAIYHQMNKFNWDISKKFLIGQAWVPDTDLERVTTTFADCCYGECLLRARTAEKICMKFGTEIVYTEANWLLRGNAVCLFTIETLSPVFYLVYDLKQALQTNVESFISKVGHNLEPPTYHRVNNFTRGFQNLINAYGTSSYRELNPGLYTVITFPFLFGIMFGDVGHGTLMFTFAAWMCITEKKYIGKKTDNEIWNIIFGGRYVILLMGAFSIYCGALYNDCFGLKFTFAPSHFKNHLSCANLERDEFIDLDPGLETGPVYKYGFDPIWVLAKNKIMTENSIKMKLSIIIGILHMIFGVLLSLVNHCYFKRYYLIFLRFIPEIVFLCCIFLWLVIMIFYKWIFYSAKSTDPEYGSSCAPQILIIFIDMTLFKTSEPVEENCKLAYMFKGQQLVQMILILSALLMVPLLLFGTPIYLHRLQKKQRIVALKNLEQFKFSSAPQNYEYARRMEELEGDVKKNSESFGELMIQQELAEMLYSMILVKMALSDHSRIGAFKIFLIFAMWAAFSVSILVVMEGLSAFLHTLRLHWVEFMSKFYEGGGYLFQPFCFKTMLDEAEHNKTEAGCKKMMHLLSISDEQEH